MLSYYLLVAFTFERRIDGSILSIESKKGENIHREKVQIKREGKKMSVPKASFHL